MRVAATVLGEVRLLADGTPIDLGGERQRALLAALLVRHGSAVPTDELVDAMYEGDPTEAAWRTFRTYVSRLRRALDKVGIDGSTVIVTVPSGYATSNALDVDAVAFEELLDTARRRLDGDDPEGALSTAEHALALWAGAAYGEFAGDEWARPEAIRLEELRRVAREVRLAAMVESGRHDHAIADIQAFCAAEPLREEPRRLLMLALYRSGRHAEALRAGREFRDLLAEQTGLDWSAALGELERMIMDQDPRLDAVLWGRRLRGYVLGEVLATTPYGVTHRASQPAVGRDVAITVVPSGLANDPGFVRRFETYAQRIASIEHPNVVDLYDYWREPGGAYLVTRFMAGGSLADRLADPTPLPPDDAVRILGDVAAALQAAAERGVHHGRLTAGTVLLDQRCRAHLSGFRVDGDGTVDGVDPSERDASALVELVEEVSAHVAVPVGSTTSVAPLAGPMREVLDRAPGAARLDELVEMLLAGGRGNGSVADRVPTSPQRLITDHPSPYRGLHAFDETDRDVFCGRTELVELLAADLRRDSFVALVGPSGAGKSSVARAGLVPLLREGGSYVATMVPGRYPVAQLAIALSRIAAQRVPDLGPWLERPDGLVSVLDAVLPDDGRMVLLIDQLEEAVTMSEPAERDLLFAALAEAMRNSAGRLSVVATARADFLGRILEHPLIGPMVRDHSRMVTPLGPDDLHAAIVGPAAVAGVTVESELASALVADASDAPGSLPLLQFALTELYVRRVDGRMTLDQYRRMGGLAASIARRADDTFAALDAGEQQAARRLFSRLITLGEGVEDTRRRVPRSELVNVPPSVLDAFGAARLLTFDRDPNTREPTVEIAHEALIRRWPRLRSWVDDDRAGLTTLRQLTAATAAWEQAGRRPDELYRGGRLVAAEEWAQTHGDDVTPLEREFLEASVAEQARETDRERRRTRRLRRLSVGLAMISVLAVLAGVIAVVQRNRAADNASEAAANATEAERQATDAEQRRLQGEVQRLVAEASSTLDEDPDLPLLLALEAYERQQQTGEDPPGNLIATLQTAVQNSRILHRSSLEEPGAIALSPDGETMVLRSPDDPTTAVVLDVESGAEVGRIETGDPIGHLTIDPSGERLAALHYNSSGPQFFSFHDLSTFEEVGRTVRASYASPPRFSPDWRYVAVDRSVLPWHNVPSSPRRSLVWDLRDLELAPVEHPGVNVGGWLADGETLVVYDDDTVRFVDPLTRDEVRPPLRVGNVHWIDVHPDRDELLVIGDRVELWRLDETAPFDVLDAQQPARPIRFGRFTPDGTRIVLHGNVSEVRIVDPSTGETMVLPGNPNAAAVAMDAAGTKLLVGGDDEAILWDVTPGGPAALGNLATEGRISEIVLDGKDAATVVEGGLGEDRADGRVRRFDLESGAVLATSPLLEADQIVTSSDGWFAFAPPDGPARVEHLDDAAVVVELETCDVPRAMDDRGRWLLVSADEERCDLASSRVVDPATGETVIDLDRHHAALSEFGPSGTIAEGLLAYEALDPLSGGFLGIVLRRISPSDQIVGVLHSIEDLWAPQFSADGRHLSVGSTGSGPYAIDLASVLGGAAMNDAIIANPATAGGPTTFPTVGFDSLVFDQSGDVLRFHDLETGAEWMTLPVDSGPGSNVRITPDDRFLYYESAGGVVRRFPLDHEELADLARSRVQRDFTEAECRRFALSDDCSPTGSP